MAFPVSISRSQTYLKSKAESFTGLSTSYPVIKRVIKSEYKLPLVMSSLIKEERLVTGFGNCIYRAWLIEHISVLQFQEHLFNPF